MIFCEKDDDDDDDEVSLAVTLAILHLGTMI